MHHIINESINKGLCLEIVYHGYTRVVEAHTFGKNTAGHDMIAAWQIRGGSVSNEPIGWKNFLPNEIVDMRILDEKALTPRTGYRRGDKRMRVIYSQV